MRISRRQVAGISLPFLIAAIVVPLAVRDDGGPQRAAPRVDVEMQVAQDTVTSEAPAPVTTASVAPPATAAPATVPAVTAPPKPVAPRPTRPPVTLAPAKRGTPVANPSAPVRIQIPVIGASAPIDPMGLNADGSLEVPKNFSRAGYYTGRPTPGEIGPAIIVAHVDSKAGPAVFYRLRDLKAGNEVRVTRADGSEVVFVVDRVEQHPKNRFPTEAVYAPTPDATLRLITCGGSFDRSSRHYRDNVIAFAHLKA